MNLFLTEKAREYKETVRKDRNLLQVNPELRAFIRAEREKLIPIWNGDATKFDGKLFEEEEEEEDDEVMSGYDNWENEL